MASIVLGNVIGRHWKNLNILNVKYAEKDLKLGLLKLKNGAESIVVGNAWVLGKEKERLLNVQIVESQCG